MSGEDPHVHVGEDVINAHAAIRTTIASTFGLAADLPAFVSTGCGLRVPYAMTSAHPESVTCLPCREHAHRRHLRFAEQVERIGRMPGASVHGLQADRAAAIHRDLARRFSDGAPDPGN
ncbi:hypothetical protein I5Q34_29160 [Streptomyces sp. AV19]|uniref:hypothetical protein n=1 Tax=Streptomyces sp. AV19 TaxID=2793068 RepID=UPI0018FE13BC|nr:hypothetical protein [Streptomyces sp. AV19]MBH1938280.1 hypothetical protein [Streptomyces sp. AV19]MDG4534910.1 hypothetical protein [Streptomyces sp. AV19]